MLPMLTLQINPTKQLYIYILYILHVRDIFLCCSTVNCVPILAVISGVEIASFQLLSI